MSKKNRQWLLCDQWRVSFRLAEIRPQRSFISHKALIEVEHVENVAR